jgi:uncharacterized protein YecA (UPF0149 family)
MGAIAEALVEYAQPLINQTDGSFEEVNKAIAMSQLCYNLALVPKDQRDAAISDMQSSLTMDEDEFDDFRRSVIDPMIRRHEKMFPFMHTGRSMFDWDPDSATPARATTTASGEAYPGTDRYAPCPCNSGEKYKFCCGKKGR